MTNNQLATQCQTSMINAAQIRAQVNEVQNLMHSVMQSGTHYGTIPGCGKKPTLMQPGADKLLMLFQLAPSYSIEQRDLPGGHREYSVTCRLTSKASGTIEGEGVGLCSTMESKYRYRKDWEHKTNGKPGLIENPDIADVYNTVLKMAQKRAKVAATLSATAASDIFTQDIEDMPAETFVGAPVDPQPPTTAPEPTQAQKAVGDAMRQAKAAGIEPKAINDFARDAYGRTVAEMNDVDLEKLFGDIGAMIASTLPQEAPVEATVESVEETYYEEDVEF